MFTFFVLLIFLSLSAFVYSETPNWPPNGRTIRINLKESTGISSFKDEKKGNIGHSRSLKLKGSQEFVLIDADLQTLKGYLIQGAMIHLRSASPTKAPLARVGVSTVASDWRGGRSRRYKAVEGQVCFLQAEYLKRNWAYPGSTVMDVVFGRCNTLWRFADASHPDQDNWQTIAIEPDVLACGVSGISHGFCLYDELGNEWSVKDGRFQYRYFPNRCFYSSQSGDSSPWLEIWIGNKDNLPPDRIKSVRYLMEGNETSHSALSWETPNDNGAGKTMGFFVRYVLHQKYFDVPRYLIPLAGKPGDRVFMNVDNLPFKSGDNVEFHFQPVDSAGNLGEVTSFQITIPGQPVCSLPDETKPTPFAKNRNTIHLKNIKIAIVDSLDKVDPVKGLMVPLHEEGYKGGNHLFSASLKKISLQSAKNEAVYFAIAIEGKSDAVNISCSFDQGSLLQPALYHESYVKCADIHKKTYWPDPLLPYDGKFTIPVSRAGITIPNQKYHTLLCEIYVPHEISTGKHQGILTISFGPQAISIDMELDVWDFSLPDKLSFVPELNAYGTVSPYKNYDYYRLAHWHRACMNRLPYAWDGVPSFAPEWAGEGFRWDVWDEKVGPLLDGAAFSDMPRKKQPVDVMYLPFSENWPVSIYEEFKPSYWADEAFTEKYQRLISKAYSEFASHCNQKKWYDTVFQFYLNNKIYYRRKDTNSSAPWIFDEPVNTQDFWALRWYAEMWKGAVQNTAGQAHMWFRADVSRTNYGRNILWGLLDIEYLGHITEQKIKMKEEERFRTGMGRYAEYGTVNPVDASNTNTYLWCLSAWMNGSVGILPWQTVGTLRSWDEADQTAVIYPHKTGPKPSLRLKAMLRGQQDVEYLELFGRTYNVPRHEMVSWLKKELNMNRNTIKKNESDAGTVMYNNEDTELYWKIRTCLGEMISKKLSILNQKNHQGMDQKTTQFRSDAGYVSVAPNIDARKPVCDRFKGE